MDDMLILFSHLTRYGTAFKIEAEEKYRDGGWGGGAWAKDRERAGRQQLRLKRLNPRSYIV